MSTFKLIPFDGDILEAAMVDGEVVVRILRICKELSLNLARQLNKLKRTSWAVANLRIVGVTENDDYDNFTCLPLKLLPMWLAVIKPGDDDKRSLDRLAFYQSHATDFLATHFGQAPTGSTIV